MLLETVWAFRAVYVFQDSAIVRAIETVLGLPQIHVEAAECRTSLGVGYGRR